jgi:hypothetical protein
LIDRQGLEGEPLPSPVFIYHERRAAMANQNERHVEQFVEVTSAEMMQIQGGVWYAKFDCIDGDITDRV